jgi:hypothetical protein
MKTSSVYFLATLIYIEMEYNIYFCYTFGVYKNVNLIF